MAKFHVFISMVMLVPLVLTQQQQQRQFVLTDSNGQLLDMSQYTMVPTFMGPFPVLTTRLRNGGRFINSRQTSGGPPPRPQWISPGSGPPQHFIPRFNNGFQLNPQQQQLQHQHHLQQQQLEHHLQQQQQQEQQQQHLLQQQEQQQHHLQQQEQQQHHLQQQEQQHHLQQQQQQEQQQSFPHQSPAVVPIFNAQNPGQSSNFDFSSHPSGALQFHNPPPPPPQHVPQLSTTVTIPSTPASPTLDQFFPEPPPVVPSRNQPPSLFRPQVEVFNAVNGHRSPPDVTPTPTRILLQPQQQQPAPRPPNPAPVQVGPANHLVRNPSAEAFWPADVEQQPPVSHSPSLELDGNPIRGPQLVHNQFPNGQSFIGRPSPVQIVHNGQPDRPQIQLIRDQLVTQRPTNVVQQQQQQPPTHLIEEPHPVTPRPPHVVLRQQTTPRPHWVDEHPVTHIPPNFVHQQQPPRTHLIEQQVTQRPPNFVQQQQPPRVHQIEERPVTQRPPQFVHQQQPPREHLTDAPTVTERPQEFLQHHPSPPIHLTDVHPVTRGPPDFVQQTPHLVDEHPVTKRPPQFFQQPKPEQFQRPSAPIEAVPNRINGFMNHSAGNGQSFEFDNPAHAGPPTVEVRRRPHIVNTEHNTQLQNNPTEFERQVINRQPVQIITEPTESSLSSGESLADLDQFGEMLRLPNGPKPFQGSTTRPSRPNRLRLTDIPSHLQGPFDGSGELNDQLQRPVGSFDQSNRPSSSSGRPVRVRTTTTATTTTTSPTTTLTTTQSTPSSFELQQINTEDTGQFPAIEPAFHIETPALPPPPLTRPMQQPPLTMSDLRSVVSAPKVFSEAKSCDPSVCQLPHCFCGGNKLIPGGLSSNEVPQMVLLTFDDSVNEINYEFYSSILADRFNPNGCPIAATFYISHEWTDYAKVNRLYNSGHEIASHSISHSDGASFTRDRWTKEIEGQRRILSALGGIKLDEIKGMRAPFLQGGGNRQFRMLYDSNFTYDSSIPSHMATWPYTLDYRMPNDCGIPPCPTRSYPGVWEIPMVMWEDLNKGRCAMADACYNPTDARGVYDQLVKNFKRHYTRNRIPFGMYYHYAWFTTPHHKEGFQAFLDALLKLPDVYFVTSSQLIEWMRQPTPLSQIKEFAPWQCDRARGRSVSQSTTCSKAKSCRYRFKGDERTIPTCQTCPEKYPWLETYDTLPIISK